MCASSAGSSMFATASWSSSGRYGSSSMIRENVACTLRTSASSSGEGTTSSGASSMRATRYGSVATKSPSSTRWPHWTRMRTVPSGTFSMRATTPTTPTR